MSAQLNTATLPQFTDLVSRMFTEKLQSLPQVMKTSWLVRVERIPEQTGQFRRFAEFPDRSMYAKIKDEGSAAQKAKVQYWYEKDLQVERKWIDISITVEMRKQGKNQEIKQSLTDLTETCQNRLDLDLSHRLTFWTATTYANMEGRTETITLWDWFQLFYTAHTLTWSATTYRNRLAWNPQFSKGSLENMKKLAVEETFNNLWEKVAMSFDKIWCTDDENTNNAIDELLNATANVTSANAGTYNVYNKTMRKVSLPRVATTATWGVDTTKAKYWGIASTENSQLVLWVSEDPYLITPATWNNGEEFSTENWNYASRNAYWIACISWRWIKMSSGDGSA